VTVRAYPWTYNGRQVLIGDAAHAIVPFYGQGMNAAFEDCRILSEMLAEGKDFTEVVHRFQQQRKPDADAIADLALRNFVEMRDLVADERFLERKKIEAELHRRFPEKWIPLYSMVTFSHRRYSEALTIGQKQDKIMEEVMNQYGSREKLGDEDYEQIVRQLES
jgi:kynurenine 3-monooxygenase